MPVIKGANGATNDLPGMVALQLNRGALISLAFGSSNRLFHDDPSSAIRTVVVVARTEAPFLPGSIVTEVPPGSQATYYVGNGA